MNRDIVQLIGLQSCSLSDGTHTITIQNRSISIIVKVINIQLWESLSLSQTLFQDEKQASEFIDYSILQDAASSLKFKRSTKEILIKLSETLSIPCIFIHSNGTINHVAWQKQNANLSILPVICITYQLESDKCRFIYYDDGGHLEPLRTLNLFPHYSVTPLSQPYRFIIFQLTQLLSYFSSNRLYPIFSLDNIFIDNNYWLRVPLNFILQSKYLQPLILNQESNLNDTTGFNDSNLSDVTKAWCQRKISNYEYLIKLNEFAGRKRKDRNRHPIFPWVCDFTSASSGYRPLNRTKYRLTKGDAQLSMQYLKQKPSYHIPELLSDICYTVYCARNETKETLSQYVRAKWVPEEYPSSIMRLYEWTPDECIPEFYEDSEIFKSIHPDMADLQLPVFTSSPKAFIQWHREMLESEEVSKGLPQWIDLCFGYQLSGKAAVAALNVHLNYIEPPGKEKFIGPVQLFTQPHPERDSEEPEDKKDKELINPLKQSVGYSQSCGKLKNLDENSSFTEIFKTILSLKNELNEYQRNSLLSIGVTIIELTLSQYCRNLASNASFSDRLLQAKNILSTKSGELPRYLLTPLLKLFSSDNYVTLEEFSHPIESYFNLSHSMLYLFEQLQQYYYNDYMLTIITKHEFYGDDFFRKKCAILFNCLDIPNMGDIWLNMFIDLLNHRKLAATACYQLLAKVTKYYHKSELLKYVKNVQLLIHYTTPGIIKLLDNQFLLSLSMAFGTQSFLEYFVPPILEMLLPTHDNLYQAVKEIVLWIARRYGPILTATYISSKLLCLLPLCFNEENQRKCLGNENSLTYEVVGDKQCKNVINCLVEIAVMFGPAFVTAQYLPFCADVFEQAKGRTLILPAWESAMIASVVCVKTIVDCLTDKQLMDQLEDVLVGKILFVAIKLFTSPLLTFSTTAGRKLLAYKTMSALHLISDRLGADNVERHMAFAIQKLFSTFSVIYKLDDSKKICLASDSSTQLDEIFTPNFALLLLHIFSFTCGRQFTLSLVQNKELILGLEKIADASPTLPELPHFRRFEEPISPIGNSLSHSFSSGNRLAMFSTGSVPTSSPLASFESYQESCSLCNFSSKVNDDNPTHLQGTWVDHFRAVLNSTTSLIPFDQIQLGTFSGHSSTIKKIVVLDNENSFITSSSDKTIKLWSLKNFSDVVTAQMSYERHTKSIQDMVMLQTEGKIVSTDSVVHIWDPFCDKTLQKLTWQDNSLEISANNLSIYEKQNVLISSHNSAMLMAYDLRLMDWANRLITCPPSESCQGVRTFALSPNQKLIASALSNGCVSVIDIRVGKFLGFAAISDAEITQLEWLSNDLFVVTSSDMMSKIFDISSQLRVVGRLIEPASIVYAPSSREYITVQPSNKFRFYADGEFRNEIKLQSDFIAGTVTAINYMSLNKMFLIGSNTGMLRLAC